MKSRSIVALGLGLALTAGIGLALAAGGFRPGPDFEGRRGHGPHERMEWLLRNVDLTEEQEASIRQIHEGARPSLDALHDQLREKEHTFRQAHPPTEFDEAAIRAHAAERALILTEIEVVRARTRSQVLAVLTPEQLEQVKKSLAERRERHGGPPHGPAEW
jgi:protein CpxP